MIDVTKLKYNEQGLIPAVVQDINTKEVLMVAYMNEEAVTKTLETKRAHYYSRSRKSQWLKGETSGHYQDVVSMTLDCDQDTILLQVVQTGVACHTGEMSCFFEPMLNEKENFGLHTLYDLIMDRRDNPVEGSYTNYLFDKGVNKILKKVGEETSEIIIGTLNEDHENVVYEISDLAYHLMVLMVNEGVTLDEIRDELKRRHQK